MDVKKAQEVQRKHLIHVNDNLKFQTNKMWPIKTNEPITMYKQRKGATKVGNVTIRSNQNSPQDYTNDFDGQQYEPLNDLGFDNSALTALNDQFNKVMDMAKTHDMGL